jgi:hypothetical protein
MRAAPQLSWTENWEMRGTDAWGRDDAARSASKPRHHQSDEAHDHRQNDSA